MRTPRRVRLAANAILATALLAQADSSSYAWRTNPGDWSSPWTLTAGPGNACGYPNAVGDKAIKDLNNGSVTITQNVASVTVAELGKSHASDNNTTTIALPPDASGNTIRLEPVAGGTARVFCRYGTLTVKPDLVLAGNVRIGAMLQSIRAGTPDESVPGMGPGRQGISIPWAVAVSAQHPPRSDTFH